MAVKQYLWNDITDTVAMEKDGAGNTTAVYQSDPVPFGRLRSMRRGGTTYNYHYDGRGNTTYLTDQTGRKTDAYTYDAFGTQRTATGSTENPYRYGGQHGYQYNPATGDYYVRARVYQPKRGRWRSKDPLRFVDGVNRFVYVMNSPATSFDANGTATNKPTFSPKHGCTDDEIACITEAFQTALIHLKEGNMRGCFDDMLKKICSPCKSGELVDCITKMLQSARFQCESLRAFGGKAAGACMKGKSNQAKDPKGACKGSTAEAKAEPAFANCSACKDANSLITLFRFDIKSNIHYAHCRKEARQLGNRHCLVMLLVHEASHSCVGAHWLRKDFQFEHVTAGIAHDACHRPDAYEIAEEFAKCHGLVEDPKRCPAGGWSGQYKPRPPVPAPRPGRR